MRALISTAIENRDKVAADMMAAIREVLGIAKNKYGEGSNTYKAFNPQDLTRLDPGGLCILSVIIVSQGNKHLSELQPKGLTAQMLTDIGALKISLEDKIDVANAAISNQLSTTETRHIAANALFDEMRDMCNTAQVYFAERNPLKASEYIIYDTAGNSQQRNGILIAGEMVSRDFDAITADSNFKLQVKDGNELVFYFSQTEAGTTSNKNVTVAVNPSVYTEVTAADLGFDRSTGYIHFCIKNNGSVETVYRVVVE
jgi:hypothetical protein